MTTKRKPGGRQHSLKVVESSRIRIAQALVAFRESNDAVYTFEADLSNAERALVHQQCSKMGMTSKSQGRGKQRRVSVYKRNTKITKKTEKENEFPNLTQLEFSEGTREVLMDLFMRYPPGEEAEDNVIYGNKSDKNEASFRKKDTIFSKPSMDKTEMAKKLQLLASKRKDSVSLRKITEETYRLPIASYKDVITSTVESNQVVLISGETGCGKTTQVPQFILDHVWGKGEACKIVCTQPRRISATSVAERISHERAQVVGQDIGYKIRLESKGGKHSSVVFCTNGILLRMLVSRGAGRSKEDTSNKEIKQDLNDITHIIMDEIHERDRHSDFMLAIIRDMLSSLPHLHLIMMSATVDAERFSEYFGGCPVIRVPGFTYPVTTFYLEDVLSILKSAENNHLDTLVGSETEDPDLTGDDKLGLDEAINLAWSKDEYDPLLELVSIEGTHKVFNYQHSLTGLTPLMVFAGKGRTEDVCMLLSFGADCQLRAKDGKTALDLAEWEDQPETTQILKEHIEDVLSNSMKEQLLVDKYLKYYNPENIDVVLIEQLLRKICSDSEDGAILVFLPGWDDINKTRDRLLMNPYFRDSSKCLILSLHSMVPSIEQKKVFKRPPHGCRKIILATNMAETAITIDDVVYVIDSGRMKEKNYDPYNNASTLQSSWVSKASAKQRRGRAGRCQPGFCYHLYSKARADSLPDFQVPEIKRMPIEELCLQVKLLDPDCKVEDFLSKTLDPPIFETIRNAIRVLQDIGALSLDEKLTELGEKLGSLPCHPLTSKMLFFAILMNCLDPALTLACAADYKDPFTLPMSPDERKRAAAAKFELSSLYGGYSDQLAVIAAFDCWNMAKQRGQEKMFCSQYFVSPSTMQMLSGMRSQLQSELIRNGFLPEDVSRCSLNSRVPGILRALLVAGLYPMVGRLLPPLKNGKRSIIETANGGKVRLNTYSINFKLSTSKIIEGHRPLIVYDEITRGEGDMNIRNCTVVAPLPLLLLSTEIAVAPASSDDNDDDDDEGSDVDDSGDESDEDTMEMDGKSGGKQEKKVMSSPDNSVVVIADRWLPFRAKALAVAQIYCLRERLSAAILFKITHPQKVLPPSLWTSVYVIAFALMHDGLPVDLPPSVEIATETEDKYMPAPQHFSLLMSLLNDNATHPHRQSPRYSLRRRVGLGPYQERGRGIMPYGNNERMHVNPHDAYQSGPYYLGAHGSHETPPHHPHQHGTWLPDSDGAAKPHLQGNGVAELSSAQSLLVPAPVTAHQKPPPSEGTNTVLRAKKRRHRARNIKGR